MPPYVVGARGYFTEALLDDWPCAYVQGVELLHSDGTSTKCGNCSGERRSDVVSFEKGEHIVGIDFGYEDDEDGGDVQSHSNCSYGSESSGGEDGGLKRSVASVSMYTSSWGGRSVSFYHSDEPQACDGLAPYVGLNDDECLTERGDKFTCKRGMRVKAIIIEDGDITGMVQEKIPKGQNERWWEKHVAYRPWEDLKFQLDPSAEYRYLAGIRAYYTESHTYCDDGYVIGIEFMHSDGKASAFGDCKGKVVSEVVPFQKDEHIVGMIYEGRKVRHMSFFTSHRDGRKIDFWTADWDNCSEDSRCKWSDIDIHKKQEKSEYEEKFVCKRGYRASGIKFDEDGAIVKMKQERIPEGQDEQWWELRAKILKRDRKEHGSDSKEKKGKKKTGESSCDESDAKPAALAKEKAQGHAYLVGVRASYATKDRKDFIVGLELRYSHGPTVKWGRILKRKMSEEMLFEKDEHIVGIDFDYESYDGGVDRLKLFTSHFEGRALWFDIKHGGGIGTFEDCGNYIGIYGNSGLSKKDKKFTCEQGMRVSEIIFEDQRITGMTQGTIPKGQNEKWYERSLDYSSDRDPNKPKRRASKSAGKAAKQARRSEGAVQGESAPFDEERHRQIVARVERQCARMNDSDYDPDCLCDSDDARHNSYSGGAAYDDHSRDRYRSSYGFDGGCYGYSARDCDDLLDQGIKPWDDDAGAALGAMRGGW